MHYFAEDQEKSFSYHMELVHLEIDLVYVCVTNPWLCVVCSTVSLVVEEITGEKCSMEHQTCD